MRKENRSMVVEVSHPVLSLVIAGREDTRSNPTRSYTVRQNKGFFYTVFSGMNVA